ncbi:hypothetical protein IQ215_05400 [Cyanobacterium stanieri LEGE 03274]|uniref:Uncharacterized protein n=1 Tax=Cyanobacterium stanieri LEGE 03274 TaxID=1828756 RepID=A0ABR9V2R8_9CHRO|nr:hypothetical protein [Cyanobacterium stanieri]MBE9222127.1 hypothetical protein [Cyanobacterium stanieri LEGE 03274]
MKFQKLYFYISLFFALFFIGGASYEAREKSLKALSGNINLKLKNAVWRSLEENAIFQDLYIDLECEKNECNSDIYGWSPKYNQDVEHQGKVKLIPQTNYFTLEIELDIRPSPFRINSHKANYTIDLVYDENNQLLGSYSGNLNDRFLVGSVTGKIKDDYTVQIPDHQPIESQEHPRLIFRSSDLEHIKNKINTPIGQEILSQLNNTLEGEIFYSGYGLNGGSHGAGYCFLALINDDMALAQKGWNTVQSAIALSRGLDGESKPRMLERAGLVIGIALAYDHCYPLWNQNQQQEMTKWLAQQALELSQGGGQGWNNNTVSNWNVRARSAAGIAALAIKNEPETFFPNNEFYQPENHLDLILATAQRNVSRYIDTALGDGGFGIEGDAYTSHSSYQMLPFLQAYANVMGKDIATKTNANNLIPQSIMRMIPRENNTPITPAYGRHREGASGFLFASGLGILSEDFLPSALWIFNRYFAMNRDSNFTAPTFGIAKNYPHTAIYALVNYPQDILPESPDSTFDKVFMDEIRGLYVFRNQWQNQDDTVASVYLNANPVRGGWLFPEATSFRITGLGVNWAMAAPSEGEGGKENIVYLPNASPWRMAKKIHFTEAEDGSGVVSMISQQKSENVELNYLRSFGVDYSKLSGADGIFAMADVFTGDVNHPSFQEKIWTMHTEGNVIVNDNRFTIESSSGARMEGIFAAPTNVQIKVEKTDYGSKIMATGGHQFLVVMATGKDDLPSLEIVNPVGINSTVTVGGQEIRFMSDPEGICCAARLLFSK